MPKSLFFLLDQNIPISILHWMIEANPNWNVSHVREEGLSTADDQKIYQHAQSQGAIVITFDEDFADQRSFARSDHCGIIRLKVWPTSVEETKKALQRVFLEFSDSELDGALIIVDRNKIRARLKRLS